MEQKKYRLTAETMCFNGVTLHRIQAIKDFGDVTAGELRISHVEQSSSYQMITRP